MCVTIILGFLIFYMQIFLVNAKSEYRVNLMNDMFSHSGWVDWHKTDYVYIIDRWININERFNAKDLLETIFHGPTVTNENVDHKIQQAHQFLSCRYAKVLKAFCEHERGIGTACSKLSNQFKYFDCIQELQNMLLSSETIVTRMQGSLSCFHQLSPQTLFNKGVFEILENFKFYYETINLTSTVVIKYVEEIMSLTIKRLSAFYGSFCWPILYKEEVGGNCKYAEIVENMYQLADLDYLIYEISNYIKKMIRRFIETFDWVSGFKYSLHSKMTSFMYDPDLLQRVNRMNKLLASPGWKALGFLVIMLPPYGRVSVKDLILGNADSKIVTKVNVEEKVQQAHQFLTCKYAITLKRCFDYVTFIWNQYSINFQNTSSYRKQFVNITMISYPLIWRMHDALLHFNNLFPYINYNREVSDILVKFNYFKTQIFNKIIGNEGIKRKIHIGIVMINIINRLIKFFKSSCSPYYLFEKKKLLLQKNHDVTLRKLEKKFTEEIIILIKSNYSDFGFPFDTTIKMKNKVIAE